MRIAICDDEAAQREFLAALCSQWGEQRGEPVQITSFASAEAFWFAYEAKKDLDVLLLDIGMPGESGMELAKKLRERRDNLTLALITADPSYALEGYTVDALAYLMKPVTEKTLFSLLDKAGKTQEKPYLLVDHSGGMVARVALSDVVYMESDGHNTRIVCVQGEFVSPHVLKYFMNKVEELEKPSAFHQIHRCYIVNLPHVSSIHRQEVVLDNEEKLPVARGRFEPLNKAYLAYYRNLL